jgi:hypothetical protein
MEFQEFKSEISVKLYIDWNEEQQEMKTTPEILITAFGKSGEDWLQIGCAFLPLSFSIEDANSQYQEILRKGLEVKRQELITSEDPDDIPF